jgi:hypothetical protein
LFRSLFRGREDVYAKRFESKKTGKSGYQPCCRNEWVRGLCEKPRISCGACGNRNFEPLSDRVTRNHLAGYIPASFEGGPSLPFVMGVYPLLQNETCCFLAVDFDSQGGHKTASLINSLTEQPEADKQTWQEDAKAFVETCRLEDVPAGLERSRSGNGARRSASIPLTASSPTRISCPKAVSVILSPFPCKRRRGKRTTAFFWTII